MATIEKDELQAFGADLAKVLGADFDPEYASHHWCFGMFI